MKAAILTEHNPKKISTDIPVMELFDTLQGEGFHTGSAAFFIRTGGCDVGCHWCDVKESWEASAHPNMSVSELVQKSSDSNGDIIVVTGGEPLMYDMDVLTKALSITSKRLHVETSGVYPLTGEWDWICFSPKKFKQPQESYYTSAHELKVVIFHPSDLEWAESHAAKMNGEAKLYLQPEWSKRDQMMPLIVDYIKDHPKWRISLQTHKYLNIP